MKIAFGGKMGVGKDTAVNYLIDKFGKENCVHVSFAEPLYDIMKYVHKTAGVKHTKDRKLLQIIGTEWGRSKDENIWVKHLLNRVKHNSSEYILLSDIRYKNELEALKNDGWICVKIIRNNVNKTKRRQGGDIKHSSELSLDNISDDMWNFIITNDRSPSKFYNQLDNLFEKK